MDFSAAIGFDLTFSRQHLKPALLVSLLTVWVLVLVFAYLNRYTRRRYFTIWTAGWLFYALWLTISFVLAMSPETKWLLMLKQWCISVSAMFLLWGSLRFLGEPVRQRLMALTLLFLLFWCYLGIYHLAPLRLQVELPIFCLIGLASMMAAYSFFVYRRARMFLGATLLSIGFFFWGFYIAAYPFFEQEDYVSAGYLIAAVLQLLIAESMIILVLEQIRFNHQRRAKRQNAFLQTKVITTEERYRSLFNQAGESIIITSAHDLRILELNLAAERMLGIPRERACQQSLTGFCQIKAQASKLPATGQEWCELICRESPLKLTRNDGALIPVEAIAAPVEYDGQRGYQFFFRELTDRSRLEQQLRQSEKFASLGKMLSGVAHELNNPLAVVKGYLELILASHELSSKTRADLEKVIRESNRASRLVQNFLAFAREQPAARELVNFNELIRGVVELRKFDLSVTNTELVLALQDNLPDTSASPDQIQQLLIIVLNNALQAMADSPEKKLIRISTAIQENRLWLRVDDSGPGVPEEIEANIFEPFFTTKKLGAGTGLGLSIAHSIMAQHNGHIRYERSQLVGGAAFIMDFPVAAARMATTFQTADLPRAQEKPASKTRSEKILVVDDERAIVEMLGEMLTLLGYQPTLCHSATDALTLIDKVDFDLVLSDIRMPQIDGQEFYRQASAKRLALSQRFVFLTGDIINQKTKSFLENVGTPHLTKPFHFADIEKTVNKLLRNGSP